MTQELLVNIRGTLPTTKHGEAAKSRPYRRGTDEWHAWHAMIQRCRDKPGYAGVRTVCKRWARYELFLADMGRRPSKAHSLDRINNNKGYSPSNCRWATAAEQQQNTSMTKLSRAKVVALRRLYHWGVRQSRLAKRFGIHPSIVSEVVRGVRWR